MGYFANRNNSTNSGSFYCLGDNREVVETFLDEESNYTIGIEEEVAPTRCPVPDYRVKGFELSRLGKCEHGWWEGCRRRLGCGRRCHFARTVD